MDKALAISIIGMGLTGAILIVSVARLFNPSIGNIWKITTISSAILFIIFAICALILRKRLDEQG